MKKLMICLTCFLLMSCQNTNSVSTKLQSPAGPFVKENIINKEVISEPTFTLEALEKDFNSIKYYIEESHPKLYADADLDAQMLLTSEQIKDGMTATEFYKLLSPLVSSLNCGHSGISLPNAVWDEMILNGQLIPFDVVAIKNKLYITNNRSTKSITLGSEILSIDGMESQKIIEILLDNITSDGQNETFKYHRIKNSFQYLYYDYFNHGPEYSVAIKDHFSGEIQEIILTGIFNDQFYDRSERSFVPFSSIYEKDYAVLIIHTFSPFADITLEDYYDFYNIFFETVKEKNIKHVILDVRGNSGGDPMVTSRLFSYLAKTSQPYFSQNVPNYYSGLTIDVPLKEPHFDGELYVLMNGECFSSTGHLLALLKYQNIGIFIGEESGGSFACTDSTQGHSLMNTKLEYRFSTQIWDVAVEGLEQGRGIMPDVIINRTIEDYLDHEDLEMVHAVSLIEKSME